MSSAGDATYRYAKLDCWDVPWDVRQDCITMLWIACDLLEMDAMQVRMDFIAPATKDGKSVTQWAYPITGYADAETAGIYIRADQPVKSMQLSIAHELMHLNQFQRLGMKCILRFLVEWAEREAEAFESQAWDALKRYQQRQQYERYYRIGYRNDPRKFFAL